MYEDDQCQWIYKKVKMQLINHIDFPRFFKTGLNCIMPASDGFEDSADVSYQISSLSAEWSPNPRICYLII